MDKPRTVRWDDIQGRPVFARVATSGRYSDLLDQPSGSFSAAQHASLAVTISAGIYGPKGSGRDDLADAVANGIVRGQERSREMQAVSELDWEQDIRPEKVEEVGRRFGVSRDRMDHLVRMMTKGDA